MEKQIEEALAAKLLAMADDELILGHRDSEWTGHAPILEEDIAFANIAGDEIGHGAIWYEAREALGGETADELIFFREAPAYRNVQMVELPNGDWAFSMVRQYLFDAYEMVALERLVESAYRPLAEAAAKVRQEEVYHMRHTSTWIRRLGLGTEESHRRTQRALDELWAYARQLFVAIPGEGALVEAGMAPDPEALHAAWEEQVRPFLEAAGLEPPASTMGVMDGRDEYTEHRPALLEEMQEVARLDPDAEW